MAIYDFSEYTLDQLLDIKNHYKALEEYGFYQDEDMMRELNAEIKKANNQNQIMTMAEVIERNCTVDENGRVIDEGGNEYRNEHGCCFFVKKE